MKLLNLGCGSRFHKSWTNIDFTSSGKDVFGHNLLNGIPSADGLFDVVYHSHVLEHFSKSDGKKFLGECFRVLKQNGIIRIAVPDLERIVEEYLKNLRLASMGDVVAQDNYEWIKLEIFDQMVRNESGGDMARYLFQDEIPNEDYVYERLGEEARSIRKSYLERLDKSNNETSSNQLTPKKQGSAFTSKLKLKINNIFFKNRITMYRETEIGRFRLCGEVHQWMYDKYSLSKLLKEIGFSGIKIETAFSSRIPNWNSYELESQNGIIYKPDSLFIEALKSE